MTSDRYLWHLTLDTGNGRRSYRDEADSAVVDLLAGQIAEMLAGLPVEIMPGYRLTGAKHAGGLLTTIVGPEGPVAMVAVAPSGRASGKLWEMLKRPMAGLAVAVGNAPEPPWCAVRLLPGLDVDPWAQTWLGDCERCLAWAWIEGGAR